MSRSPRGTLYPQKLALTSPTSGSRLVGIVHSRAQATEFVFFYKQNTVLIQFPIYTRNLHFHVIDVHLTLRQHFLKQN
jgi:hypothetical protein